MSNRSKGKTEVGLGHNTPMPWKKESLLPFRLALLGLFALAYVAFLGIRPMVLPDEFRYAEIAREMLDSGDWVVPRLLGRHYFEKPIGGYWMIAIAMRIFGDNAFALRLPSALATGGSAYFVYLLAGRIARDERLALTAAMVYLSSVMVFAMGTFGVLDPMLTLTTTASLFALWRIYEADNTRARIQWWILLGLACGAGFLIKGFVALAVPVVVAGPFFIWTRRWRELLTFGPLAILSAALVAGPWSLLVHQRAPDFWNFFFWHEHIRRFASGDPQHPQPVWYFLPVLAALSLPWLALVPLSIWRTANGALRRRRDSSVFLLIAFAMPALFFSLSRGKLATYILPCWAPLSIMIAECVINHTDKKCRGALNGAAITVLFFGITGLVAESAIVLLHLTRYGADEPLVLAVSAALFVSWCVLGLACLVRRQWVAAGVASMALCLAPAYGYLAPQELKYDLAPQETLNQLLTDLDPNTVIATANVKLAPALAWSLKRTNVTIVGGKGELAYGLEQSKNEDGHVQEDDLPEWIRMTTAKHPIKLLLLTHKSRRPEFYPTPDDQVQRGQLFMLSYNRTTP